MGRAYQNRKESMAKTSNMKARIYSRFGREIYVCAKDSGCDTNANLSLRSLIDKAKKNQVPSHVIEKAIDKARGGGGEDYSPARYEGFGPGGCIAIIECLTDNPNRTICDVRQAFTKTNSKIGTQGTVSHMFDHLAIFSFEANDENEEEKVLDVLMEADINVVDIENEDNILTIFSPHTEYSKTKQALTHHQPDIDFKTDEIQYIPQNHMTIDEQDQEMFDKFLMMLDECDDVQNVYHNVKTI
jgi:YebC/PmpR family DNA-binding regulatory protein